MLPVLRAWHGAAARDSPRDSRALGSLPEVPESREDWQPAISVGRIGA